MVESNGKPRVLIVDDEEQIGKVFSLKLRLAGFDAESTTSGAHAIELVRCQHFDVMVLDVLMPGVSGLDVLDRVRTFSKIPVIVFTAKPDMVRIAKGLGASDYVSKPVNPDILIQKIRALLDGRKAAWRPSRPATHEGGSGSAGGGATACRPEG